MSIERHGLQLQRGQAEAVPVAPKDFHHLLATASLFVGDSQSVAAEAAILGVPSLRLSGFTGTAFYLGVLERLGIMRNFYPGEEADLLAAVNAAFDDLAGLNRRAASSVSRLNREAEDLRDWFRALVTEQLGRRGPATH